MRFIVNAGEVLEIKVRIYLGRADVGVPKQFLHGPQVAAGLEQVRGEGVPEHVRMHVFRQTTEPRPVRDAALHDAGTEPSAAHSDEYRVLVGLGDGAAFGEPRLQRRSGVSADGHDPGLAALAEDPGGAVAQVEVRQVEAEQFTEPQSR
jgi:hypothetical protein